MIKLTKLTFEMKESTHQRLEDISAIYQEEVQKADNAGLPMPATPKPVKLKNKDFDIEEGEYYVQPKVIEEIWVDSEGVTVLSIAGKEVYVKESAEEVFNLIQEKNGGNTK